MYILHTFTYYVLVAETEPSPLYMYRNEFSLEYPGSAQTPSEATAPTTQDVAPIPQPITAGIYIFILLYVATDNI
jgi:hypothetical protein